MVDFRDKTPYFIVGSHRVEDLHMIHRSFNDLIVQIKSDQNWQVQQEHEWSLPSFSMFEDLLRACIRGKNDR